MRNTPFDLQSRILLILVDVEADDPLDLVRQVSEDLWTLKIINVNIVVGKTSAITVLIYTYHPFVTGHCDQITVQLIHFSEGGASIALPDLYPSRLQDFEGCPLTVGAIVGAPFLLIGSSGDSSTLDGVEGRLVRTLMSRLNFSIDRVVDKTPDGQLWGVSGEPHERTGMRKLIQELVVDFGVGAFAVDDASIYMKSSIFYFVADMVFAVPKARPFSPFEKLCLPLETSVWVTTFAFLTLGLLVIGILRFRSQQERDFVYGRGVPTPVLNLFAVFFGIGMERTPRPNFARTLLMFWIGFCFVIRTVYQSALYQHLQTPMLHNTLSTFADIDQSGNFYYTVRSSKRYLAGFPNIEHRIKYLPSGENTITEALQRLGREQHFRGVFLVNRDIVAAYNLRAPKYENVWVASEVVVSVPLGLNFVRGSPLKEPFDRVILNLRKSGIIGHWLEEFGDYDGIGSSSGRKKIAGADQPKPLSMDHLSGAFQLYLGMVLLCIVVFVGELLFTNCLRLLKNICPIIR
ncbi:ionotropic receptor 21a-like [Uranotaenia lowii]|uniref:ionotropic receptor 21a-like n=1 Tax=Uranotaenia lowii TaxID=190385 RepID=UPI002479B2DC|nr:ionotropic receptor 21a-like [Uranotaenia lowii]